MSCVLEMVSKFVSFCVIIDFWRCGRAQPLKGEPQSLKKLKFTEINHQLVHVNESTLHLFLCLLSLHTVAIGLVDSDQCIWYLMWVNLDWFLSTIREGPQSLYIHAVVYTPVEPVQHVRKTIYRLITQIIPSEARSCLTQIKHRLDFRLAGDPVEGYPYPFSPDEITFTSIRFTHFWSLWHYGEDYPYTTDVPPSPPESPDLGSAARTVARSWIKCVFDPITWSVVDFRFDDVTSGCLVPMFSFWPSGTRFHT